MDDSMKKYVKNALKGYGFIAPIMIGCFIFYIIPFGFVLKYSVRSGSSADGIFIGLENYRRLISSGTFRMAFGNTFRFLLIGLPLILVFSYAIALILKIHIEKHKLLKSVFLLPFIMPVAGTVVLVEYFFAQEGILNQALYTWGLPLINWLESPHAFWIVMLLYLWKNTGYSVVLLLAGLMAIPKDQYDSAELEGANVIQKFLYITSPQMWYSVFLAVLFSMINAFKCFREIFLIGGEHPNRSIYMLQHFLNNSFENLNYRKLSTASVLLFAVIVLIVGVIYVWLMKKGDE